MVHVFFQSFNLAMLFHCLYLLLRHIHQTFVIPMMLTQEIHNIRHAMNVYRDLYRDLLTLWLFHCSLTLSRSFCRTLEKQNHKVTFNVKFIFQMKYVIFNHTFEKVYPPVRSMSSEERPPCLCTLIRR